MNKPAVFNTIYDTLVFFTKPSDNIFLSITDKITGYNDCYVSGIHIVNEVYCLIFNIEFINDPEFEHVISNIFTNDEANTIMWLSIDDTGLTTYYIDSEGNINEISDEHQKNNILIRYMNSMKADANKDAEINKIIENMEYVPKYLKTHTNNTFDE
jgi:hypothetical protein